MDFNLASDNQTDFYAADHHAKDLREETAAQGACGMRGKQLGQQGCGGQ